MFLFDKIVSALLTGHAPRTKDKWPARPQLSKSVNKITVLPYAGTWPSRDLKTCAYILKSNYCKRTDLTHKTIQLRCEIGISTGEYNKCFLK